MRFERHGRRGDEPGEVAMWVAALLIAGALVCALMQQREARAVWGGRITHAK